MSEVTGSGRTYTIAGQVAKGGMGAILSAKDKAIGRTVAMKVLLDGSQGVPEDHLRFQREAQILGQLEHPNIVPMYELARDKQGQPYYTMKFVQGRNLKDVLKAIKEGEPETLSDYPLSQLLTVFQKICDAIAYAHSKGVIHRDLKPENVMLGEFGEVLVMDWGLAKVLGVNEGESRQPAEMAGDELGQGTIHAEAPELTLDGQVMGTPQFMAPEQAEGRVADMDERTDIFALGGLLYNILSLRSPTSGKSTHEILENIRNGYIAPPIIYNKARKRAASGNELEAAIELLHCPGGYIPEALSAVAMKAMALDPMNRYQSVPELQAEISKFQGGFATMAEGAGVLRELGLFIKRNKALGMASAVVLVLLSLFLVYAVFSNRKLSASNQKFTRIFKQLKDTAPTFYAQARTLADSGEFDEAMKPLDNAIALAPDEAAYRILRANLLQTTMRFREAVEEYEAAVKLAPNDFIAKHNLELSRQLASINLDNVTNRNKVVLILQTNAQQQARVAESFGLSRDARKAARDRRDLQEHNKKLLESWRAQLKEGGILDKQANTLSVSSEGGLTLDLTGSGSTNLTCLAGIPITDLTVTGADLRALEGLRGMPLKRLGLAGAGIDDLRPLAGMQLETLGLSMCRQLHDLAPLKGMKLRDLDIAGLVIGDFSPLKGMPLDRYRGAGTQELVALMGDMPLKTELVLDGFKDLNDISFLKDKPLSRGLHIKKTKVSDLSPLAGKSMQEIDLDGTLVRDLSPLRSVKFKTLNLSSTPVVDLSSLAGSQVTRLILQNCANLRDVSPLAECPELKQLAIPYGMTGVDKLRDHPKLEKITCSTEDPIRWENVPPIAEFWKGYDAQKKRKK